MTSVLIKEETQATDLQGEGKGTQSQVGVQLRAQGHPRVRGHKEGLSRGTQSVPRG